LIKIKIIKLKGEKSSRFLSKFYNFVNLQRARNDKIPESPYPGRINVKQYYSQFERQLGYSGVELLKIII
jgi:hypothetical protein